MPPDHQPAPLDPDYLFDSHGEPNCPTCDGTGEVVHEACQGSGCGRCLDGAVTCEGCQRSGYRMDDDGEPMAMSDWWLW